ncbi:MAG: hypothetical protein M3O34_09955 [Chloroflexota bacterium]|nr:hypothetical protein [Chloroflexota bacterium]
MAQRKISADETIDVSRYHHTRSTDPPGSEVMLGHPNNGSRIKIVVARGSDPPFVFTIVD